MYQSILLLVVLHFALPSYQAQAEAGSFITQSPKPEAKRLYEEGMARMEMGQVSEAVERFQHAVEIDPEYREAYSGLGRALFKLKQWEKAVGPLRRAMELKAKEHVRLIPATPQPKLNQPLPAPGTIDAAKTLASITNPPQTRVNTVNQVNIDVEDSPPPPPMVEVEKVSADSSQASSDELALTNVYPDELIENSKAFVGVLDYTSHSIVVEGLVRNPGTKLLKGEAISLAAVLAEAQPLRESARVTVKRNGMNQVLETELNRVADMIFQVQPGDVVTLDPVVDGFFYIGGKVKFRGEKTYRFGLTLTQAIITAGGATSSSKVAEINRDGELPARFDLNAIESGKAVDPLVKPGDRIILH